MDKLKVVNGEICYLSEANDQTHGMWCPVNYDTPHNFEEHQYLVPEDELKTMKLDIIKLIDIAQDSLNMAGKTSHAGTIYVGADRNFAKESLKRSLDKFKSIYKDEDL